MTELPNNSITNNFDIFEGDLRDFALILEATKDIEIIFHQASRFTISNSFCESSEYNE